MSIVSLSLKFVHVQHRANIRCREMTRALLVRLRNLFRRYQPEFHYMRGPGPKWHEKHGSGASKR